MDPARPRPRLRLVIVGAFALAWTLYLVVFGPRRNNDLAPPNLNEATASTKADFSWKLLDLDDQPVALSQFEGRPILLNIWATWCGPCVKEMPSIASLAADPLMKAKDVVFLCVSVDTDLGKLRAFAREQGKDWKMTLLHAQLDEIPAVYQSSGIPATYLISPEGQVVAGQVGASRWDDPSVIAYLEKLAAQVRPKP